HGDCRQAYEGQVVYGRDAFADLRFMDALMEAKAAGRWDDRQGFLDGAPEGVGLGSVEHESPPSVPEETPASAAVPQEAPPEALEASDSRSEVVGAEPALQPPFWGSQLLDERAIDLEEMFAYLDRQALFAGQWQLRKAQQQTRDDYEAMLAAKAEPVLAHWKQRCLAEGLLTPRVGYGYFPCGRDGNAVVVFDPATMAPQAPPQAAGAPLGCFQLPRQRGGNRYCIADFFRDLEPGPDGTPRPTDVLPMQAVTMGEKASAFARELFAGDQYSDYLYFHGLAVQMAEALAEWVHARIRRELGFADPHSMPLREVLAQRYRGSRYSFGYPACPNVADSRLQLAWLDAERIGLRMDESDQLEPEQSTTALVALHSRARYFSA
ncbi:MAG: vitamin B12 dependent-methionine synthase activation domain-containing protein, partial [Cyanobium sp.]